MQAKSSRVDFVKFAGYLFLSSVILVIISFTFLKKYTKIRELSEEKDYLSSNIEKEEQEIERLKNDLDSLDKDPFFVEKIAREQLGAVKENEVLIRIEE